MSLRKIKKCLKKALANRSGTAVKNLDMYRSLKTAPPKGFGFDQAENLEDFVNNEVIPCFEPKYRGIVFTLAEAQALLSSDGDGGDLLGKLVVKARDL